MGDQSGQRWAPDLGAGSHRVRSSVPRQRQVPLRVLDLPAGEERRCCVLDLAAGGVPWSQVRTGPLELVYAGALGGVRFRVFLDLGRSGMDAWNVWVHVLGDRLGVPGADIAGWQPLGDALVTGALDSGADASVPDRVLEEAYRGGLLASAPDPPAPLAAGLSKPSADVTLVDGVLRIGLDVALRSGDARQVVITVRPEIVTLEFGPNQLVVLQRRLLRSWLDRPIGPPMLAKGAGFVLHYAPVGPQVAVKIPNARACPLSSRALALLRELV